MTILSNVEVESSTIVRTKKQTVSALPPELTSQQFRWRAMALRLPWPNRTKHAADLFCSPLPGTRARAERALFAGIATPMVLKTVQSADTRWQSYVVGDPKQQPYLLCSHGWSSFGLRFAPWFEKAQQEGFAIVCFDHTAHGRSEKKTATFQSFVDGINAMRAHYGEPYAAIGHSLGAAALAVAAAEYQLRVPLVLIAPPASLRRAVERFAQRLGLGVAFSEQIIRELSKRVGRKLDDFHVRHFASAVRQRILVAHDTEDTDVSINAGLSYAMLAPRAQWLQSSGLGHHKIVHAPKTIEAAFTFLSGAEVGQKLVYSGLDLSQVLL